MERREKGKEKGGTGGNGVETGRERVARVAMERKSGEERGERLF